MNKQRIRRFSPLSEPVDLLLADIAIHIQLSATDFRKMGERYKALRDYIDRPGSLLRGRVQLVYAQGSMAIGATVASRLTNDEHDVDFIAQLELNPKTTPKEVLDLLFHSIRGEKGSLYFRKVERRNRCVTVHYADKMHADITPMIQIAGQPERESLLFHNKPNAPEEDQVLIANPFGFAEWFKKVTSIDREFAEIFAMRAGRYERLLVNLRAESEEIPDQEPVNRKAKAVVALQLIKRWRNVLFDKRSTRRPPSVMISKKVADAANNTSTLSQELLYQAQCIHDELFRYHQAGGRIQVFNPVCDEDEFTDRWPGSLHEQGVFLNDLNALIADLKRLNAGCDLREMREIMIRLFGEAPTGTVFETFNKELGKQIESGQSLHKPDGGRIHVPASGIITGGTLGSGVRSTPRNTFHGMKRRKKK